MERRSVLILGHGSRRPAANAQFEALVARFRARRPDLDVGHAYIELAAPLLADGLAALARRSDRVTVLPLFLFAAGHVKEDVPEAIEEARRRFPSVRFETAAELGVDPAMVAIALDRAGEAVPLRGPEAARTVLLTIGRGSLDSDANGNFYKLSRIVAERGGFARPELCFIAVVDPLLPDALERAALSRPERLLVLPYFLFEGLLMEQIREEVARFAARHPEIQVRLAGFLGPDERLCDVLDARLASIDALDARGEAPTA
ncbi:MAG TPA: sirohydrochlorin chelatase [Anaeromyxobacteraceae bacterium]|nr:sirohydrochlorin chelatase [Anaeromyxobacteraceae bacterium]